MNKFLIFSVLFLSLFLISSCEEYPEGLQKSGDCGDCTPWVAHGCGAGTCTDDQVFYTRQCSGIYASDEKPGMHNPDWPLNSPEQPQYSLADVPEGCIKKCVTDENCGIGDRYVCNEYFATGSCFYSPGGEAPDGYYNIICESINLDEDGNPVEDPLCFSPEICIMDGVSCGSENSWEWNEWECRCDGYEPTYECGDGIVDPTIPNDCELPNTEDNEYCSQSTTSECDAFGRVRERDGLGSCGALCLCQNDDWQTEPVCSLVNCPGVAECDANGFGEYTDCASYLGEDYTGPISCDLDTCSIDTTGCTPVNPEDCTPGTTQDCPLQLGVCAGSQETCNAQGEWPGCTAGNYGSDYESVEVSCSDGLDNDCDGDIDDYDIDCAENPECFEDCTIEGCEGQACSDYGHVCVNGICDDGIDVETICYDGIDNDQDGPIDCSDMDCDGLMCWEGTTWTCDAGACVPECVQDTDCDEGYVCDVDAGECVEDVPVEPGVCGNGILEAGEECDSYADSCGQLGYGGIDGFLSCYPADHEFECTYDVNYCSIAYETLPIIESTSANSYVEIISRDAGSMNSIGLSAVIDQTGYGGVRLLCDGSVIKEWNYLDPGSYTLIEPNTLVGNIWGNDVLCNDFSVEAYTASTGREVEVTLTLTGTDYINGGSADLKSLNTGMFVIREGGGSDWRIASGLNGDELYVEGPMFARSYDFYVDHNGPVFTDIDWRFVCDGEIIRSGNTGVEDLEEEGILFGEEGLTCWEDFYVEIKPNFWPRDYIYMRNIGINLYGHEPTCQIEDVYVNDLDAGDGDIILSRVRGFSECKNVDIELEVWDADNGDDDFVESLGVYNLGESLKIDKSWEVNWQCDGYLFNICFDYWPEYYVRAKVVDNPIDYLDSEEINIAYP